MVARLQSRVRWLIALLQLGAGIPGKIQLFVSIIWLFSAHTLGLSSFPLTCTIRSSGKTCPLLVSNIVDLFLIKEIFSDGAYETDVQDAKTIVDLGSNIGISVAYFAMRYPLARIYAVEPNPRVLPMLKRNVAQFGERIMIHAIAITNSDKAITLHIGGPSTGASIHGRKSQKDIVTVQGRSLDNFIRSIGSPKIDILKFDIEGAEADAFVPGALFSKVTSYLVGELHADLSGKSLDELISLVAPSFSTQVTLVNNVRAVLRAHRVS